MKALLAVVLIVLVLILALRLLESGKIISLDGLRNTVGTVIPLDVVFPKPDSDTIPDVPAATTVPTDTPESPAFIEEDPNGADSDAVG